MNNVELTESQVKVKIKFEQALKFRFGIDSRVVDIVTGIRFTKFILNLSSKYYDEMQKYKSDFAVLTEKCSNIEITIEDDYLCIYVQNDDFSEKNITYRSLISSSTYQNSKAKLPIPLGVDFNGNVDVVDLRELGYMLCAGIIGSGISEMTENIILSLVSRFNPSNLKLMLIEPKNFNLRTFDVFEKLPHLLGSKIFKTQNEVLDALNAVVDEINRRFEIFSDVGAPNIESFNNSDVVKNGLCNSLPYVVVIINKFENVISINNSKIERIIQIITSRAKACGINLIVCTEKPTTDVLTSVVLKHIQSKLIFKMKKISSNYLTIIPESENLFNHGDMILLNSALSKPMRLQYGYIDYTECTNMTKYICEQYNK